MPNFSINFFRITAPFVKGLCDKSGLPDKRYRIPFREESFGNPVQKDLQILILPSAPYKTNNFRLSNAL